MISCYSKGICSEKLELMLKSLDESIISCLNKESFLQTIQMKIDRVTGKLFVIPSSSCIKILFYLLFINFSSFL
jgi:hypothetical protein